MPALLRGYSPQGYAVKVDRFTGKVLAECETFTCIRCNGVIHVPTNCRFEDVATLDYKSMKIMCVRHANEDDRRTFIQKVEPEEDRDAQLNIFRRLTI